MIDDPRANPVRHGLVERAVDWPWSRVASHEVASRNDFRPDPIEESENRGWQANHSHPPEDRGWQAHHSHPPETTIEEGVGPDLQVVG